MCLSDILLLWKGECTVGLCWLNIQETSQRRLERRVCVCVNKCRSQFPPAPSAQWLASAWLEWRQEAQVDASVLLGHIASKCSSFVFLSLQNQQSHMEDRQGHGPDECHRPATPKPPHLCDFAGYPDLGASAAECRDSDREGGTGAGIRLCGDWGR